MTLETPSLAKNTQETPSIANDTPGTPSLARFQGLGSASPTAAFHSQVVQCVAVCCSVLCCGVLWCA